MWRGGLWAVGRGSVGLPMKGGLASELDVVSRNQLCEAQSAKHQNKEIRFKHWPFSRWPSPVVLCPLSDRAPHSGFRVTIPGGAVSAWAGLLHSLAGRGEGPSSLPGLLHSPKCNLAGTEADNETLALLATHVSSILSHTFFFRFSHVWTQVPLIVAGS